MLQIAEGHALHAHAEDHQADGKSSGRVLAVSGGVLLMLVVSLKAGKLQIWVSCCTVLVGILMWKGNGHPIS